MQFNDNQPIWLQIYDHACRAIVSGRWPERERIPSIRELAVTLQVNPNTVMRAYDKLGSDGLILIRRGMGFFVAEGSQARTLEAQRHEFIRVELHTMFARMDELGMDKTNYDWYLNLRKFGGVEHAGYGLGFERMIMYLTGIQNIRDVLPFPRTAYGF